MSLSRLRISGFGLLSDLGFRPSDLCRLNDLHLWLARHGVAATLPCYKTRHKYRGKTVTFDKPLFPGYVFLQLQPSQKDSIRQSDHVANLLEVADQETLQRQLEEILRALETGFEVRLAPTIGEGMRVRIKSGPLQGVEGLVEHRHGPSVVLLRLDFINRAVAVKLEADMLEAV